MPALWMLISLTRWAMTRPRKYGNNENKRNRSNTTEIAEQQLPTAVGESATMHFR
jgi:hypothetical protein